MYYLDNFETAMRWIADRYSDLLDESERSFQWEFTNLPRESRALLVRLIMRKGDLFRESKVRYPELGDLEVAADPLIRLGWLDAEPALGIDELFKLFRRAELAVIFGELRPGVRKDQALERLRPGFPEARTLQSWLASTERVFRVMIADLCDRFRFLFFGNFRQEWSEFVLADLGLMRYEKVEFSRDSRAFQCRQDIDQMIVLSQCRRRFQDEEPLEDVLNTVPRTPFGNEWLESRRAKLLFQIAHRLEREGRPERAAEVYSQTSHPGARARRSRLLEKAGRHLEAGCLIELALQTDHGEAERQQLLRIRHRVERRTGIGAGAARVTRAITERLDLLLPRATPGVPVETAVLEHLATPESPVFYVENALINSLFGLLFWEAMFSPVRGAFFHPFQSAPADLHSPSFRSRRAAPIAAAFAAIQEGRHRSLILDAYRSKQGLQSAFVYWGALNEPLLDLALECMPAAHLIRCFERILADPGENSSGLPDLVQFRPAERRYRMIEVKGPGDRVQDNQRRWMNYCALHGIPIAVCHVKWSSAQS